MIYARRRAVAAGMLIIQFEMKKGFDAPCRRTTL
jgi:hypothetical protein